jgi:DNA-binding LytR/AlgR family response regulator
MEKFKYIIIDDEPPAHITVRYHVKAYQNYSLIASFYNAKTALTFLQENDIDLIFLDIEMPEMNGFQFLEALNKNIFVVILTAYPDKYSLKTYDYWFDKDLVFFANKAQFSYYLPKIIARFEKMHEEKEVIDRVNQLSVNEVSTFPKVFRTESIPLKDILFFTIIGHNIVLKLKNEREEVCRMSLKELTSILPPDNFLRINRSVIVNTMYITAFTDATVCILEHHFRISTRRRKAVVANFHAMKQELYNIIN